MLLWEINQHGHHCFSIQHLSSTYGTIFRHCKALAGWCLLTWGKEREELLQATFQLPTPSGNSKPEGVPECGCFLEEPWKDLTELFACACSGSALEQATPTLVFFPQNLPELPAGSPASQGQRRVTLVTDVGASLRGSRA